MKHCIAILFLVLSSLQVIAKEYIVRVKVLTDFDEPIAYVSVFKNGVDTGIKTNCDGQFKLLVTISDVLVLKKAHHLNTTFRIERYKRFYELNLSYDYEALRKDIAANFKDKHVLKSMKAMYCQPVFIVDGKLYNDDPQEKSFTNQSKAKSKQFIDKDDICNIKVLKGFSATNLLGKGAMNGAIFITSGCADCIN